MISPAELGMALRIARREMRSGVRGFGVFLACLALGVASVAAVGTFSSSVDQGLAMNARAILGGDIQLVRTHVPVNPEVEEFIGERGEISRALRMRTMARGEGTGDATALVELKAVDGSYPLYGAVELASGRTLAEALAPVEGLPGAVTGQAMLDRMGLAVGDAVRVGEAEFRITDVIAHEPDRVTQFWALGPRFMISLDNVGATGVVRPGALVRYVYNLRMTGEALPGEAEALAGSLHNVFPDGGFRSRSFPRAARSLTWLLDNVARDLILVGLATLLVGGIGVAGAVRAFLAGREKSLAVMKALGAPRRLITAAYLFQTMGLALTGSVGGAVLGCGVAALGAGPLAERIGVPLGTDFDFIPPMLAVAYGLLTALAFSLWPLSGAGLASPARLFRGYADARARRPGKGTMLACALTVSALFGLLTATSGDRTVTIGFAVGSIVCIALFWGYLLCIRKLAARIPRVHNPLLRQALANLNRPGASTGSVVFSLGLGLTVLVLVTLSDGNVQDLIERQTPSTSPSFFFIDIPRTRMAEFEAMVQASPGVQRVDKQPSIRGRIVGLKGHAAWTVDVHPDTAWALRSDRGLTFAAAKPDKVKIKEGQWWPEDYSGPPLICLDARVCEGFGMTVGDTLTVNVLGRRITATVACTRSIDWTTGGINHTIIFSPGVLEGAPYTWIATAYADKEHETALWRSVTRGFPEVVAISMREVLDNINEIIDDIGRAMHWAAGLALVAGLLVLGEAMRANLQARHYDAVVFKVLGATRRDVILALALEFTILGAAAAALASILGTIGAYIFVTEAMNGKWVFLPVPLAAITIGGVFATVVLGLIGVRRTLSASAWPILRNE